MNKDKRHEEIMRLEALISDLEIMGCDLESPIGYKLNNILIGLYKEQIAKLKSNED